MFNFNNQIEGVDLQNPLTIFVTIMVIYIISFALYVFLSLGFIFINNILKRTKKILRRKIQNGNRVSLK